MERLWGIVTVGLLGALSCGAVGAREAERASLRHTRGFAGETLAGDLNAGGTPVEIHVVAGEAWLRTEEPWGERDGPPQMEGTMKILSTLLLALALCIQHTTAPAQTNGASAEPAAELKTLTDDYTKAERAFFDAFHKAKTDAERGELWKTRHPARDFLPRFQALAQRAQGTETGAHAIVWIMEKGGNAGNQEAVKEAVRTLPTIYVQSPVIEDGVRELSSLSWSIGAKECTSALRTIIEQSPHPRVRAAASFTLATILLQSAEGGKTARAEARSLFESVKTEYAETPYAKEAPGYIFELENLQIGMKAPDFEATDQDGQQFKLSDYRGKVVVLDFWGFW
jgi:hypothetical protein